MTRYYTNFASYTTGVAPSDWTEQWNTGLGTPVVLDAGLPAGAISSKALRITQGATAGRYGLSWNVPGTIVGDFDVLVHYQSNQGNPLPQTHRAVIAHGSGAIGAENGYLGFLTSATTFFVAIGRYLAGVGQNVPDTTVEQYEPLANTWYWARLRKVGDAVSYRVWPTADPEPTVWHSAGTNTELNSGWVGVGMFPFDEVIWWDYYAVGTAGDVAPIPQTNLPSSIGSEEAFGQATVKFAPLLPSSIVNVSVVPNPTLALLGSIFITPGGIESVEEFGAVALAGVSSNIFPSGIPSEEAIGNLTVPLFVGVSGIESEEAFSDPMLGLTILNVGNIASPQAVPNPVVLRGVKQITVTGIGTAEVFGLTRVELETIVIGGLSVFVLDQNGNPIGGPLTIVEATPTDRLDKMGEFEFVIPAADERAALLQQGREVQIFLEGEGIIASGFIEEIGLEWSE